MNPNPNKPQPNQKTYTKYENPLLHRILYRGEEYYVNGPQSTTFNRKKYELPIQSLELVNNQNLGFTNRILQQKLEKNLLHLFVPVYLSLKVKSINQMDLEELTAKMNCALIIYILTENLPDEVINALKKSLYIQLNKQGFLLNPETPNVKMKVHHDYIQFTLREMLQTDLDGNIFLTPFETLNLVLSITLNSLDVDTKQESSMVLQRQNSIDQPMRYIVSFNCMRCPDKAAITYLEDCRFGVYDLAEKLVETYPSNLASLSEIRQKFMKWVKNTEEQPQSDTQKQQSSLQKQNIKVPAVRIGKPLKINKQGKSSSIYPEEKQFKHYFQYIHFVIPVYKRPENSLATIFIPMFMLAILSIAIFVQSTGSISQEIGTIATFVLSFIALIPSIKSQVPPSQQLTLSEIIAYVGALNSMLSLLSSFYYRKKSSQQSIFKNPLFVLSLLVHLGCFLLLLSLLLLHKFSWQKVYTGRRAFQARFPHQKRYIWSNPYCDQVFLHYNQKKDNKLQITPYP